MHHHGFIMASLVEKGAVGISFIMLLCTVLSPWFNKERVSCTENKLYEICSRADFIMAINFYIKYNCFIILCCNFIVAVYYLNGWFVQVFFLSLHLYSVGFRPTSMYWLDTFSISAVLNFT